MAPRKLKWFWSLTKILPVGIQIWTLASRLSIFLLHTNLVEIIVSPSIYLLSESTQLLCMLPREILIAQCGSTDREDFAGSPSGCDKTDSVPLPLSQEEFFPSVEQGPVVGCYGRRQWRREWWIRERGSAHNPLLVDKESPKERKLPLCRAPSVTSLLSLITTPRDKRYCFLFYTCCMTKINTFNSYHVIEYKTVLNQLFLTLNAYYVQAWVGYFWAFLFLLFPSDAQFLVIPWQIEKFLKGW